MRIVALSGPPASGKGTQCEYICQHFHHIHLSVGDLLRQHTKFMPTLQKYIEKGELVPDDLVVNIVKARLAKEDCSLHGVVLDGFPRTINQGRVVIDFVLPSNVSSNV